jgi:hypothetical protein
MDLVADVARAVLYEGYILWPYRRSAMKNRQRWTFGGVFPEPYSRARGEDDAWQMQTECLVEGDGDATVDVHLCFLHVVERRVARVTDAGLEFVDELQIGDARHVAWEEATERQVLALRRALRTLDSTEYIPIGIPAGEAEEWLTDASGARVAVIKRSWEAIDGMLELSATRVGEQFYRVTARLVNRTAWRGELRDEALRRAFVSTHTILNVDGGSFVSLMGPPEKLRAEVESCRNIGTWPVLAGEEGSHHTMLSSPIILYDYPRVAPESPGDLFDSCEIDQLLVLNMLTLTDEERREMRDTDPRTREMLERCQSLSPEQLLRLHGVIRDIHPIGDQ